MSKEERLKLIEDMLEKNPKDSFLNYAASLEYHKYGKSKKAISILEKLISFDPKYLGAYYQLGKYYEELNQVKKAIEVYKKGRLVAKECKDEKTHSELTEALLILDDTWEEWD
jgi:tetratricopeptide (TPR) repeat protein